MEYKDYIKNLLILKDDRILLTNKNKSILACVELLEEEVTNFDYEGDNDLIYIFSMFNRLSELLKDNEQMQNLLYDRFTSIHNIMQNILHAKPDNLDQRGNRRYELLKNIIKKMENTMLYIYLDSPAKYDPDKNEFIYYIIFEQKYINLVRSACEKFPHIVNSTDKKGRPLIESVLNHYLDALRQYISKANLGPIDDLIYYDKVLKTILTSDKLNIDDYSKKMLLEKVKNFAKRESFKSNRHKEKFSFFVNNVIDILCGVEEEKTIEHLSYKYEVHDKFKEAHNQEAKRIYFLNKDIGEVSTDRKIYTFDGEGAKELDDGISLTLEDGIYHLGVHIANPSMYIPDNSILWDEAKRRTTSLYMGNDCIPLFPFLISGDTMSLNEGKNTYATSYYYDIDARTGELLKFDIKKETIRITKNLTYEYYDHIFDHGSDDQEFLDYIINLTNLSEILKQIYNEDQIYHEFHNDRDKLLSTNVVASAMIYTNYHVAKYFADRDLPFIYRCHTIDQNNIDRLIALQKRLENTTNNRHIVENIELLKNLYPRAYYSLENKGHEGLGIQYYAHATSPERREADNVVNKCLNTFVFNEYTNDDIKYMKEYIDEVSEIINTRRSSLQDYEIQYMRLKYSDENKKTSSMN